MNCSPADPIIVQWAHVRREPTRSAGGTRALLGAPMALWPGALASERRSRGPRAGDVCARNRARRSIRFGNPARPLAVRHPSVDLAQRNSRAAGSRGRRLRRRWDVLSTRSAHLVETNILAGEVLKGIGLLPEAQRETVLLIYGEGYSYVETAMALEIPIDSVMSCLAAARVALAKLK